MTRIRRLIVATTCSLALWARVALIAVFLCAGKAQAQCVQFTPKPDFTSYTVGSTQSYTETVYWTNPPQVQTGTINFTPTAHNYDDPLVVAVLAGLDAASISTACKGVFGSASSSKDTTGYPPSTLVNYSAVAAAGKLTTTETFSYPVCLIPSQPSPGGTVYFQNCNGRQVITTQLDLSTGAYAIDVSYQQPFTFYTLRPDGTLYDQGSATDRYTYTKSGTWNVDKVVSKENVDDKKSNSNAQGTASLAPGQCPVPATSSRDPVDLATRDYYETVSLISVDAPGSPLEFALNYNSASGWKTNYDISPAQAAQDRRQRSFEFTPAGKLTAITDRLGFRRSLTYGPTGQLTRITDNVSGRSIDLAFDAALGRFTVSSAGAGAVTVDFDGSGQVLAITDALGKSTRYAYAQGSSRLAAKTDALGVTVVTNTYDPVTLRVAAQDDASAASPLELFSEGTTAEAIIYRRHQSRLGGVRTIYIDNFARPTRDQGPLGKR
jgi:YD repeat-containing protein